MQITFYDKNMHETAVADNALLNAIKINKASLTSFFEEATHQVEFEFSKESGEWWGIKENGYLAFRFLGDFFRFSIVKFKENAKSKTISIIGDYFNLEMLSENCLAYENQPARTIVEHLTAMEFFPYANFEIGVNELATSKKTLKYEGEDVKYKRLISIINNFGGECEFEIKQKRNGQFDKLILNIYKANDGVNYQGVGRNRRDFEITIDNSNDVSRTFDMTDIKTAIEPIGKDGLRLGNRGTVWKNEQGQTEFYQKNNRIYAPIAAENMPKVLDIDDYLLWKLNVDTDDVAKLESEGLKWLKNVCYGKETIEVSGSFDVRVGDTVILNHKGIGRYGILGSLRVMKITWNLLTGTNEVTFSNFKRLASKISAQGLALQDTIESPASYDIAFNTTAGTVFKNNTGVSTVSFNFFKNGTQTAVLGQRWYNGTQLLSNGLEVTIKPDMLTDGKLNLRLEVDVTDAITFSKELTFINVNDGSKGADGNGITSTEDYYLVSTSKTGITSATTGWVKGIPQVATATNKYHWHYHVDIYSDGARKETVPAVIGIYGDQGLKGDPGKDGQNGQIPHIAYADITEIVKQSDPEFKIGANTLTAYNNLANGNVVMERITAESDAPSNSGYMLKISNIGTASPGLGGVKFGNVVNSNEVYIYTIVAKIPIGYTIEFATNSIGNDGTRYFLTSTAGTGKYETYKYQVNVGTLSTASSSGYFFINGSQVGTVDAPTNWYIAFANYSLISANNFSIAPLNSTHIGVYVDDLPSGSTDWKKYAWTLTKGQKGDQGIPGLPGADGKTPYWHTAWANSADGKTDFSLTDPTGRKYRGEYADYTQTDSTDPTKYKWVDMTANVKTGSRNLLVNTKSMDNIPYTSANKTSETYMGGSVVSALAPSGSYKDAFRQKMSIVPDELEYIVSFYAKSTAVSHNVTCYFYAPNTTIKSVSSQGVVNDRPAGADGSTNVNVTNEWKRYWIKWTLRAPKDDTEKIPKEVIIGRNWDSVNSVSIALPALYAGNLNTEHSEAPEDVQAVIDANQALTQAQMLALEERSALARDNAIAEAMKNTISEVEAKWQTWYNLNTADEKQKVANDIASLFERVAKFEQNLGEASARFEFINNETLIGEEGVAIGDKEGKAKLFLSNDSISFVTNGVAQMTLTGDTLTIKNGLFTERIQIGNYVEEVYDRNPLYNVIRPIKYS